MRTSRTVRGSAMRGRPAFPVHQPASSGRGEAPGIRCLSRPLWAPGLFRGRRGGAAARCPLNRTAPPLHTDDVRTAPPVRLSRDAPDATPGKFGRRSMRRTRFFSSSTAAGGA